jgi:hypothetical protein
MSRFPFLYTIRSLAPSLDPLKGYENLYKLSLAAKRLKQAETLLWRGDTAAVLKLFERSRQKQVKNFCDYVRKHQARIVNYDYYQAEGICSIGSGAVESSIKQVNRRIQISGAQWNSDNVSQVLAHRCAYLNGLIGIAIPKKA